MHLLQHNVSETDTKTSESVSPTFHLFGWAKLRRHTSCSITHEERTGDPQSLLFVVRDYLSRYDQRNVSVSLPVLFEQYLDSKEHRSAVHAKQLQAILNRFSSIKVPVSDIEMNHLLPVLDELSSGTRNRYLRILRAVFNFAVRRNYTKENPAAKIDFTQRRKKAIDIFSNETVEGMLKLSLQSNLELVPYLTLGAFCGLRVASGEMSRLLWSDIQFEEKTVIIRAENAKTHRKRFVPLPDCASLHGSRCIKRGGRVSVGTGSFL
jgi:integrase